MGVNPMDSRVIRHCDHDSMSRIRTRWNLAVEREQLQLQEQEQERRRAAFWGFWAWVILWCILGFAAMILHQTAGLCPDAMFC